MYNDELEPRKLSLEQLFLDPNNPRFSNERDRTTGEAKIPDSKIQERTQRKIEEFGVKEVRDSILRNGFLPMDRIINGHGEKYVVVEGNRRLAALKSLHRLCPDFVVELRSPSDSMEKLRAKMREYIENQARLGWLIDRKNRKVEIYRQGQDVEILDNPTTL